MLFRWFLLIYDRPLMKSVVSERNCCHKINESFFKQWTKLKKSFEKVRIEQSKEHEVVFKCFQHQSNVHFSFKESQNVMKYDICLSLKH